MRSFRETYPRLDSFLREQIHVGNVRRFDPLTPNALEVDEGLLTVQVDTYAKLWDNMLKQRFEEDAIIMDVAVILDDNSPRADVYVQLKEK